MPTPKVNSWLAWQIFSVNSQVCTSSHHGYKNILCNLSGIDWRRRKPKRRQSHSESTWSLEIGFKLSNSTWEYNTWTRSPPGSYLDLDRTSGNSDVVFHARFPCRLGEPSQPSRPSPLRNGVPPFSAPRLRMTNVFLRGSRLGGHK
jgi:hypothetical protein